MSSAYVSITGYLAADPVVQDAGQTSVTRLRVATHKRKGQEEVTTWWSVSVWGRQGENCAKFLQKGRLIALSGDAYARFYTDKDGNERMAMEVEAKSVDFGFGKGTEQSSSQQPRGNNRQADNRGRNGGNGGGWKDFDNDPVPF